MMPNMFGQSGAQAGQQPQQQYPQAAAAGVPGSGPAGFNMAAAMQGGAGGNPGSQQSQAAAYNQYAQLWYASLQAQGGAAQGTPGSNPAAANPAAASSQADLAANYQNYLMQYQQQNQNASQSTVSAMGSSGGAAPVGVPPPNVAGAPGASSAGQANATNPAAAANAFNFQGTSHFHSRSEQRKSFNVVIGIYS